nr:PAS domain-containing protein [Thioalkalivibrio sulfidiphilus]
MILSARLDPSAGLLHADGSWRWHPSNASPVLDESGRVSAYMGIAREITQRKQQEAQIHHLAHHDLLTGLPNRSIHPDGIEPKTLPQAWSIHGRRFP